MNGRIAKVIAALRTLGYELDYYRLTVMIREGEVPIERLVDEPLSLLYEKAISGDRWRICDEHGVAVPLSDARGCPVCFPREAGVPADRK